jgi:hypothetical protein
MSELSTILFFHGIYDSPWIFAHEKPAGVGAVCLGRTDAVAAGRGGREAWPQNLGIFMFFFFFEGNIYKVVNHGKPRNKPEYRLVDHSWVYHIKGI